MSSDAPIRVLLVDDHQLIRAGVATLLLPESASRELHPILRDEIYRITGEALRNAFRHARARSIEVEIQCDPRQLRVRVRDARGSIRACSRKDARGIMGYRACASAPKRFGGQLEVWSEQGAGTEVELKIPASVAYARHGGQRFRLFKSKVGTDS